MPATVQVEKKKEGEFLVTVTEGRSQSSHRVTVRQEYYEKLSGGNISAEELVRRSFEFLLEREPKESILSQFDLTVIARYFSDYEQQIQKRLAS